MECLLHFKVLRVVEKSQCREEAPGQNEVEDNPRNDSDTTDDEDFPLLGEVALEVDVPVVAKVARLPIADHRVRNDDLSPSVQGELHDQKRDQDGAKRDHADGLEPEIIAHSPPGDPETFVLPQVILDLTVREVLVERLPRENARIPIDLPDERSTHEENDRREADDGDFREVIHHTGPPDICRTFEFDKVNRAHLRRSVDELVDGHREGNAEHRTEVNLREEQELENDDGPEDESGDVIGKEQGVLDFE